MASPKPDENTEMEEDVPEGFFDDFSNNDFMAGLDVVDAWEDNVDGKPSKEKTTTTDPKSTTGTKSKTTDAKRNNAKKPKLNSDKKRKAPPLDDKVRRDPNKTKRDIQRYKIKCAKDKEAKYVSEKLRVVETGLVPPGTEMEADVDFVKEQAKRPDLRSRIKERQRRSHSAEKVEKPEKVILREASPSQLTEGKPRRMSSREPRERDRRINRRSRSHERHRFNNRRSISPLMPRYRGIVVKQQKHRSRSRDYRSRFSNERHRSPREMELTRGLLPDPPPRSLSPFNKKGQTFLEELERKLNNQQQRPNFLDEMREKFSATPSSNSPHLPEHMGISIPPPNMMQMQHMLPPQQQQQLSQPPYGLIAPAPVPVPPVNPMFVHMQQQQQQQPQIYDQSFFIGPPQPEMMVNQNPVLIPNNLGSGFMPMPSNNLPQHNIPQQQHNIPPQQQQHISPQQHIPHQQQHNIPPQQQQHHNIPPQQQHHIPPQQQHHNLPPQHPNIPLQLPSPIQQQQSYQANLTKIPQSQLVANMIDKTSLNKLFNDKQISLTDFLSITSKVSGGSKPADLSKKIKVISLCQDAIKIMNKDSKLSGRFFFKKSTRTGDKPASTQSKTASPLKRTLPIRYTYTSSTSKSEQSRNSPQYTNAQRLLIKMGIVQVPTSANLNVHRADTPDPPNIPPQATTIATSTTTTKDTNNKKPFNWKEERNVLNKMCQTDRVSLCTDCTVRKKKTFATIGTQCEIKHFESISVQVKEDDFLSPARAALKGLLKSQSLASLTPAQLLAQMGGGKSGGESMGDVKRLRTDSAGPGMGSRRDTMEFEAPRKMYFDQPQQFPQSQPQQHVWQGNNNQFNQGGQQFGGPNNQPQQLGFQPPQNQQNQFPNNNWNQNNYGGSRF